MPCGHQPTKREIELSEKACEEARIERKAILDKLTRMLCELCKYTDEWGNISIDLLSGSLSDELIEWWAQHQKDDRKKKEELKKIILAKLSKEEREVLGI